MSGPTKNISNGIINNMEDPNKHITNYLDHYCLKMENPGFAVLIKGDWGSGKTWFVKNYIEEKKDDRFLYLSLYGLNDTREIDDLIFEILHPFLSSKSVAIIGKIFKSALRLGLKIDLDQSSNSKLEAAASIPAISLNDFIKKLSSKVIIFDDLERNRIEPTSLLGYINTFIEHQKLKVILIGDEQKILNKGDNYYSDAKEKIIGHTFNIIPRSDNALKAFITEIKEIKCYEFLMSIESKLLDIFNKINYNNLRDLRQSLLSFEYLYMNINDEYKKDYTYFERLIIVFIYLSLELKANKITPENWEDALEIYFYKGLNQKEFEKLDETEKKKILDTARYSIIFNRFNIPLGKLLFEIIFNGRIDPAKINNAIRNSQHFTEKNKSTLAKLLIDWRYQSSADFKINFELLIKELQELKYCHPGELLHCTDLFLFLSDKGLIPLKEKEIINLMESIIDQLITKLTLIDYDFEYGIPEEYGGVGFARRDTTGFNCIWNKLNATSKSLKKSGLILEIQQIIESFPENYSDFYTALILVGTDGRFSKDPVLSFIDISKFFAKYLLIPNELKRYFIYALKDRYELKYSNGILREQYYEEERFIIEFKEYIDSKIKSEDKLYNTDNFILQGISDELKIISEYFKKHLKENSIQNNTRT
jgi:hypothetical protein